MTSNETTLAETPATRRKELADRLADIREALGKRRKLLEEIAEVDHTGASAHAAAQAILEGDAALAGDGPAVATVCALQTRVQAAPVRLGKLRAQLTALDNEIASLADAATDVALHLYLAIEKTRYAEFRNALAPYFDAKFFEVRSIGDIPARSLFLQSRSYLELERTRRQLGTCHSRWAPMQEPGVRAENLLQRCNKLVAPDDSPTDSAPTLTRFVSKAAAIVVGFMR
jgi:uncharacterized protein (DUF488 family)